MPPNPPKPFSPEKCSAIQNNVLEMKELQKEFEEKLEYAIQEGDTTALERAKELKVILEERLKELEKELSVGEFSNERLEEFDTFLKKTFGVWGVDQNTLNTLQTIPTIIDPRTINFEAEKDITPSKFGQYTLNPEMSGIDLENYPKEKIKVIELPSGMNGKRLSEVEDFIINNYGATHYLPGVETWKFILEDLESAAQDVQERWATLKDGNYHFFPGSLVRGSVGRADVPYVGWSGSGWGRGALWLDFDWASYCRVVLLEK
jgi:hypothetical protein